MITRFLMVTLALWVAFAVVAGAAQGVGRLTHRVPSLLAPGACQQPCWHGLRPGEVTADAFAAAIRASPPLGGRATGSGQDTLRRFEIITHGAMRLGDVLRDLGQPERVGCLGYDHSTLFAGQPIVLAVDLYFAGGLVVVNAVQLPDSSRLSPAMRVRRVTYYAPGEPAYAIGSTTPWRGFAAAGPVYRRCSQ